VLLPRVIQIRDNLEILFAIIVSTQK